MEAFVAASDLPKSAGDPFCNTLNHLLAANDFDAFIDSCGPRITRRLLCRPGVPSGVFFRMLFVDSYEGIKSHRLIS